MLRLFHVLMDIGWVYRFAQLFGRPTVQRYRTLIRKHVPQNPDRRVLEIGCGVGSSRPLFAADYTGIDINPDYIRIARQTLTGAFEVMDASQMSFAPDSFDDAVSIATGHHLSDDRLAAMVRKATGVAATIETAGNSFFLLTISCALSATAAATNIVADFTAIAGGFGLVFSKDWNVSGAPK